MHYISNPPNYFVEKLHASHYKGNDDDKALCRIIISRAEAYSLFYFRTFQLIVDKDGPHSVSQYLRIIISFAQFHVFFIQLSYDQIEVETYQDLGLMRRVVNHMNG